MVIDVKPATTLAEAADQMEEAIGMCADHYVNVCDVVLSNWSILCKSVDVNALLELADELEEDACWEVQTPGNASVALRLKDTCDRIHEALGVDDEG